MAEHEHGNMDVRDQERVFAGFTTFVTRSVIVIIVALVFLALIGA